MLTADRILIFTHYVTSRGSKLSGTEVLDKTLRQMGIKLSSSNFPKPPISDNAFVERHISSTNNVAENLKIRIHDYPLLTTEEVVARLQKREALIVEPGDPIPLRDGEKLTLTMVEGLKRRDIPEILLLYSACVQCYSQDLFTETEPYEKTILRQTISGAELKASVHATKQDLLIELWYNGQKIHESIILKVNQK